MSDNVVCRHVLLAPTEEGKKLDLTYEQEHLCKIVYNKTEDGKGYAFHDFWDPEQGITDSGEYIILPLRSTYKGTFSYTTGDCFANVLKSTPDPEPYKPVDPQNHDKHVQYTTWKELLADKLGMEEEDLCCVMQNCYYVTGEGAKEVDSFCDDKDDEGCIIKGKVVGGHVIKGMEAYKVGEGNDVYLLPICHRHNFYSSITGKVGAGYYMKPRGNGTGAVLTGYLEKEQIKPTQG